MPDQNNIICFAKDWTEDPTSNNHVMRLLAQKDPVLWLNSIASRKPDFSSKRDLGKIVNKLKSFTQGPKNVAPGLNVYTPIVLPFPHSELATQVNEMILQLTVGGLRRRFGMDDFQLWSFLPTAEKYVGKLGESLSVYYCTDNWSQFSYVDTEQVLAQERALCEKVDLVFCTSKTLVEEKKAYNPETHLASHGVSHEHFSKALDPNLEVHPEIAHLPKPVIGFFGLIQDWIDVELFAYLAEKRPDWSIVVIGKWMVDDAPLRKFKNVTLIDRRPYDTLPAFCRGFDVGLCPFRINELTLHVNPIKLREYLCAGLPVVSTNIPECRHYPEHCTVADTHEEFLQLVDKALAEDSPEARQKRSDEMKNETWEKKVEQLLAHVARVKAQKLMSADWRNP